MSSALGATPPRGTRNTTSARGDAWVTIVRRENIPERRLGCKTAVCFDAPFRAGYDHQVDIGGAIASAFDLCLDYVQSVASRIGRQIEPLIGHTPHSGVGAAGIPDA